MRQDSETNIIVLNTALKYKILSRKKTPTNYICRFYFLCIVLSLFVLCAASFGVIKYNNNNNNNNNINNLPFNNENFSLYLVRYFFDW